MSREMKFRAWLKNKKKMIKVKAIDFIEEQIRGGANWYDFNEIELMQWTGLKDKNGVKIFEGDIVKFDNDVYGTTETFKVVWSNEYCEFLLSSFKYGKRYLEKSREKIIEVIGNVFEDKELLGDNNDL